jgi:hypothetical protein
MDHLTKPPLRWASRSLLFESEGMPGHNFKGWQLPRGRVCRGAGFRGQDIPRSDFAGGAHANECAFRESFQLTFTHSSRCPMPLQLLMARDEPTPPRDLRTFSPLRFPSGQEKQWQPLTSSRHRRQRGQVVFLVPRNGCSRMIGIDLRPCQNPARPQES